MDKMPEVGSWVRLAKSRSKQSAQVVSRMENIKGGLRLDRRLDGFQCWNALDVEPDTIRGWRRPLTKPKT